MRASIYTHLSLYEWGKALGIHPFELAQVGAGFPGNRGAQCPHVFYQYQYQKDFLSREEVAQAIVDAENMVAHELNYWPAPHYTVDEVIPYPRPHQSWRYGVGTTPRGDWKPVETRWHKVVGGGVFNRTQIGANHLVNPSDPDGDGINDFFTITPFATTVTNPNEIAIYYKASDRNNEPISETWRIRPVNVTISGGNATVTGSMALLVKPDLTLGYDPQNLDVTLATNFVSEVETYRVFRDDTATASTPYQGVAIWDELPDCTTDCGFEIKELCIAPRHNEMGRVAVNYARTGCCPPQNREPDRVQINYLSGVPLESGYMSREMALIVARLATALLPSEKCGCERSNRILHNWRAYPSDGEGAEGRRPMTPEEIQNCPWEPRMGALYAYKRINYLRQWGAVPV